MSILSSNEEDMDKTQTFIEKITREAGEIVLSYFRKNIRASYKEGTSLDIVTEADFKANEFLVKKIKEKFPEHGIISEEMEDENKGAEYVWIIDPLDGTHNFFGGLAIFNVVVTLTRKMTPAITAIYDPVSREMLLAQKGRGVKINGVKVRCSDKKNLDNSVGLLNPIIKAKEIFYWSAILRLAKKNNVFVNIFGSSSKSAYALARGSKDWWLSFDIHPWDNIPAVHVLTEAGCRVINLEGNKWKPGDSGFVAANKYLHKHLINVLNNK
ncbi:MAG: inositol monophosphatase [Patescibacteria group bacterium]|jgi:myo-inositol-1(or 4)-monophosphatase